MNSLNELTSGSRSGTLTVAGTTTWPATNVTVSGTGLSSGAATLYGDNTWARAGATPADGNNSYTATARDSYGRQDTNSITVNLPATNIFAYDLNGNMLTDGTRSFAYDDENQLVSVWENVSVNSNVVFSG